MIEITVPGKQHPSLNTWTNWHWAKKAEEKEAWVEEIGWLGKKFGNPQLENALVEIIYYFETNRRRDKDNYTPKFIMDGLTAAGLIDDDNDDNIFLNWKLKVDKDNPRTEIKITERGENDEK